MLRTFAKTLSRVANKPTLTKALIQKASGSKTYLLIHQQLNAKLPATTFFSSLIQHRSFHASTSRSVFGGDVDPHTVSAWSGRGRCRRTKDKLVEVKELITLLNYKNSDEKLNERIEKLFLSINRFEEFEEADQYFNGGYKKNSPLFGDKLNKLDEFFYGKASQYFWSLEEEFELQLSEARFLLASLKKAHSHLDPKLDARVDAHLKEQEALRLKEDVELLNNLQKLVSYTHAASEHAEALKIALKPIEDAIGQLEQNKGDLDQRNTLQIKAAVKALKLDTLIGSLPARCSFRA